MGKMWQRYLQKQEQDYCIISNQLYHKGKDGSLRMCVVESKYVPILEHAHASILGRHYFKMKPCLLMMCASAQKFL